MSNYSKVNFLSVIFPLFTLSVLSIKPKSLCMLVKYVITELQSYNPYNPTLIVKIVNSLEIRTLLQSTTIIKNSRCSGGGSEQDVKWISKIYIKKKQRSYRVQVWSNFKVSPARSAVTAHTTQSKSQSILHFYNISFCWDTNISGADLWGYHDLCFCKFSTYYSNFHFCSL